MTYGILLVTLLDPLFLRNVSLYDLKKCLLCELNLTGTGKIRSFIFYANDLVFLGAYRKVPLELNEFSDSFILLHNICYSYNRNEVIPIYKVLINLPWEALLAIQLISRYSMSQGCACGISNKVTEERSRDIRKVS